VEKITPTVDPNKDKTMIITYPNGGEILELGTTINLTWTSTKGINDAVKLSLYKSGKEYLIINSNTSNSGSYNWDVPLSIPQGEDYQFYIEWLSASTATDNDKDLSDNTFGLFTDIPSFSSSSEKVKEENGTLVTTNCKGIPILELSPEEHVSCMVKDEYEGIIFGTSTGRILACSTKNFNAYLTGERTVYAEIWDGFGNKSSLTQSNFMYALYNKIAEITQDKEIVTNRYKTNATIIPCDKITAIFTSQLLYVKEDMGLWKELIWEETKPTDSKIIICIRTGTSEQDIQSQPWKYCFQSTTLESGVITRALNNINLVGSYMQLKVEMRSYITNDFPPTISPIISKITVKYSTKHSFYFFTTKFSLEKGTKIKNGLLIANMTEPINTEIKFGIVNNNSVDWNDYQTIEPEKLVEINDFDNVKVGIKFISYDLNVPSLDEFSLILGDDKKQIIST